MRKLFPTLLCVVLLTWQAFAIPKPHVISFGKWMPVKWYTGAEGKAIDLRIRALFVDTRLKEYTTGPPHEITDRLFAVRRMFRLNDALPAEAASPPRWVWERGGWLLVDRVTGRVSQINLPEFDPFYSTASWYRDYIAYCGVSDDGKKVFAMVARNWEDASPFSRSRWETPSPIRRPTRNVLHPPGSASPCASPLCPRRTRNSPMPSMGMRWIWSMTRKRKMRTRPQATMPLKPFAS